MQRLCKYELLLANYLKNTDEDHVDFINLENVKEIVENLVKETNEAVGEFLLEQEHLGYVKQFP